MKLKNREYVAYKDAIGVVHNPGVNQESVSVKWIVNPANYAYYQPKEVAEKHFEVIPKDVAENLLEVLNKNG